MQKLVTGLVVVGLVVFMGCNQSEPGGKGTKDDSFTVKGPTLATAIKQGETQISKLTVSRGKNFKEDVTLSTGELPKGVKVEFVPATVKASENGETEMKITAGKDTPVGESKIVVNAKPAKGSATTLDVKINVEKSAG